MARLASASDAPGHDSTGGDGVRCLGSNGFLSRPDRHGQLIARRSGEARGGHPPWLPFGPGCLGRRARRSLKALPGKGRLLGKALPIYPEIVCFFVRKWLISRQKYVAVTPRVGWKLERLIIIEPVEARRSLSQPPTFSNIRQRSRFKGPQARTIRAGE